MSILDAFMQHATYWYCGISDIGVVMPMKATYPDRQELFSSIDNIQQRDSEDDIYNLFRMLAQWHLQDAWIMEQFPECTADWFVYVMMKVLYHNVVYQVYTAFNRNASTVQEAVSDQIWRIDMAFDLNGFKEDGQNFEDVTNRICAYSHIILADEFGWNSLSDTLNRYRQHSDILSASGNAQ